MEKLSQIDALTVGGLAGKEQEKYDKFRLPVKQEIAQLRTILESAQAKVFANTFLHIFNTSEQRAGVVEATHGGRIG